MYIYKAAELGEFRAYVKSFSGFLPYLLLLHARTHRQRQPLTAVEVPRTTVHLINTFKFHNHDINRAKEAWDISFCFVVRHMGQKRRRHTGHTNRCEEDTPNRRGRPLCLPEQIRRRHTGQKMRRHTGHTEQTGCIQMFVGFRSCLWVFGPLLVSVVGGDAPRSASRRFP